jgi:hypothetical protein
MTPPITPPAAARPGRRPPPTADPLRLETTGRRPGPGWRAPIAARLASMVVCRPDAGWPWHGRQMLHLAVASIPVLAISAHVFWSVSLLTVAVAALLPLIAALAALVMTRPHFSDRLVLAGFIWGMVACAGYDAFRLPTVYAAHWWPDFFGSVGGWATGTHSSFLVGYLWRYIGDGGGIAVAFFALAATLGAASWSRRTIMAAAVAYAVCPVWTGLILTDFLAPHGRELFPLTLTTLTLGLVGHLIYGAIMGLGYWHSRPLEAFWPFQIRLGRESPALAGRPNPGRPGSNPARGPAAAGAVPDLAAGRGC